MSKSPEERPVSAPILAHTVISEVVTMSLRRFFENVDLEFLKEQVIDKP
jgi:hypothetical protein